MSVRPPLQPMAQGAAQGQAPAGPQGPIPQTGLQQPSGRQGQPYNPQILNGLDQHLNSLPPKQQQYLTQYMAPELAVIFGIVMGQEAFDYFKKVADPQKMLTVVARPQGQPAQGTPQAPQQGGQAPPQQTQQPQQGQAPQGATPPAQAGAPVQPQPQQATPGRSIMGV